MWKGFLESDCFEVTEWLRDNNYLKKDQSLSTAGSGVCNAVAGFTEKKKQMVEKSIIKYNEKYQDKLANDWGKVAKNCTSGEMKILNDFSIAVHAGKIPRGTKELKRVFEMFRLALGKSTNNNQNTNANFDVPLSKEEEQEIADRISKDNAFYNRSRLETVDSPSHEEGTL